MVKFVKKDLLLTVSFKGKNTDELKQTGIRFLASLSRIYASDEKEFTVQYFLKIILNLHGYFKILFFVDSSTYLCVVYIQNRMETIV